MNKKEIRFQCRGIHCQAISCSTIQIEEGEEFSESSTFYAYCNECEKEHQIKIIDGLVIVVNDGIESGLATNSSITPAKTSYRNENQIIKKVTLIPVFENLKYIDYDIVYHVNDIVVERKCFKENFTIPFFAGTDNVKVMMRKVIRSLGIINIVEIIETRDSDGAESELHQLSVLKRMLKELDIVDCENSILLLSLIKTWENTKCLNKS